MELHKPRGPGGINEAEGVDPKALDHPQRTRDGAVGHHPHQHVHRLRAEGDEVPEVVMGRSGLGETPVRFHLHGVDQVGELHGILNEEDRDIVADEIVVALRRVELHRKAPHIAREVRRAGPARHGGEPRKHLRLHRGILQERGFGDVALGFINLEITMRA